MHTLSPGRPTCYVKVVIGCTDGSRYDSGTEAGPGVCNKCLPGGVWKGGEEECCAALPGSSTHHRTVQSFGTLSEALSESPAVAVTQKRVLKQRLFKAGNNKQPDGRQHEQSIQLDDRPEVPGEASSRYRHHPQWVKLSCWVLTLGEAWTGFRCFPETRVRVGRSATSNVSRASDPLKSSSTLILSCRLFIVFIRTSRANRKFISWLLVPSNSNLVQTVVHNRWMLLLEMILIIAGLYQ